jgi:tripartite-type tricarboxylate transporter receptor subunit TctC
LTSNLPFDPVRDFAPVTPAASSGIILVCNPALPVKSVRELIALARKNPGKLTFGSSGTGGSLHLSAELFKMLAGINMLHVPYKGAAPSLIEVVGGQVDMMFIALPPTLPHIRNGRLRALGMGGAQRSPALPDLPTIAEQGVAGYEVNSHFGVLAPGGTPRDIIQKLNAGLVQALQSAYVKERFAAFGTDAVSSTPEQYAAFIKTEIGKWTQVVKKAGIRSE